MGLLGVLDEKTKEYKDGVKRALNEIGENKEIIECLIKNESGWNINAVGDSGKANGILQFHRPTFEYYKELYNEEWLEYENPIHQIILTNLMLKDNLGYNWTTYNLCQKVEKNNNL